MIRPGLSALARRERRDALGRGFVEDALLRGRLPGTCGLDVLLAWPLPFALHAAYLDFTRKLRALGEGLYIYPFGQTHVTLATVVDFHRTVGIPPADVRAIRDVAGRVARALDAIVPHLKPFQIEIGPPIAGRRACFFGMSNPSGEVRWLRSQLQALAPDAIPNIIHSTFARYRAAPRDPRGWLRSFNQLAAAVPASPFRVEEILVAIETRPYLCSGEVIGRHRL